MNILAAKNDNELKAGIGGQCCQVCIPPLSKNIFFH
jgi:hypothetical protein